MSYGSRRAASKNITGPAYHQQRKQCSPTQRLRRKIWCPNVRFCLNFARVERTQDLRAIRENFLAWFFHFGGLPQCQMSCRIQVELPLKPLHSTICLRPVPHPPGSTRDEILGECSCLATMANAKPTTPISSQGIARASRSFISSGNTWFGHDRALILTPFLIVFHPSTTAPACA